MFKVRFTCYWLGENVICIVDCRAWEDWPSPYNVGELASQLTGSRQWPTGDGQRSAEYCKIVFRQGHVKLSVIYVGMLLRHWVRANSTQQISRSCCPFTSRNDNNCFMDKKKEWSNVTTIQSYAIHSYSHVSETDQEWLSFAWQTIILTIEKYAMYGVCTLIFFLISSNVFL